MGNICPKNSPKRSVNRQFQAKTPKSINRNISGTIYPTNKLFEDRVQTTKGTSWVIRHYPKANTAWLAATVLKIDMTFGRLMQNKIQISGKWSRSKLEVEFQYSGRLFFQTRSSYISAINWYMSTKFGLLIDFDLLKARTSTNTKPEVVLSGRSRHLEKSIWRHISAVADPEWHNNNGNEVKIETEKSDGLKARHCSLVVRACKSRVLFLCTRMRFGWSWTTVYR